MTAVSTHGRRLLANILYGRKSLSILDAGAGDCRIALELAEAGHDVVAVDRALPLPTDAWTEIEDCGPGRLRVIRMDVRTLKLSEQFDRVLLLGVLHYARNSREVEAILEATTHHLKPDGQLGLTWILATSPSRVDEPVPPSQFMVKDSLIGRGLVPAKSWTAHAVHDAPGGLHRHLLAYQIWMRA